MLRTFTKRRAVPVAAGLMALSLALTGCGGDDKNDGKSGKKVSSGCEFKSGSSSDGVKVEGAFGETGAKVEFDKPLKADGLQRTIVTKGDGEIPKDGEQLDVVVSLFNGRDGSDLGSMAAKFQVGDDTIQKQFQAVFECVPAESRTVTTFSARDYFGDTGNEQAGIKADDTIIVVGDVIGVTVPLKPAEWSDAPTVTFNGRKSPKVDGLATGAGSKELLLKVLKPGTGPTVGEGDSVTVNYMGINQRTGKVFDQSYGAGKAPVTFTTDGVVAGFGAALVGQKVGTRLIVSIPPKDGYGAGGEARAGIKGTDVIVFVVEIQSTQAAS